MIGRVFLKNLQKVLLPVKWQKFFRYLMIVAVIGVGLTVERCATNPATGERHLNLYSESQEIAMGKQADKEISSSLGLYEDKELADYIQTLGENLAVTSERPNLPWTFRVLDDPVVNAFALPGGYIYVTRGILSHLNNEAELAGVIGHEIGHVTAQHSVHRMSSQQIFQFGLGAGMILVPELQRFGQLASKGLALMFLQFSREDENQADELGVRYMSRESYDAREMVGVMSMLDNVSKAGGGGRVPEWLSTHPDPGNRKSHIQQRVDMMDKNFENSKINRETYLDRVDGLVYGQNPREGYFKGSTFCQPDLKFRFDFPQGWETVNMKQAVIGSSPNQGAIVQITLTDEKLPDVAADKFLAQEGIIVEKRWAGKINKLPEASGIFSANTNQGVLRGQATFIDFDARVYQVLGYSTQADWPTYEPEITRSIKSFNRLTDPDALSVQPMRLKIITLEENSTLDDLSAKYQSPVSIDTLALINNVNSDDQFMKGQKLKMVVGQKLQ